MAPSFNSVISSAIPSLVVTEVVKDRTKETITLPFLVEKSRKENKKSIAF